MLNYVNSNDFASAKKGADDLEHQWDTSEPKLRKIDGTTWTKIDGTIDVVLAAVRSGNPDASQCKSALNNSLSIINGANKLASQTESSQTTTSVGKSQADSPQNKLAGQLTDLVKIESDMLNYVNSNDFASAKKGADNLEHQWDTSEPKLRKIDGKTWTQIDGTIDVVLAAVRSANPDASKCKSALNNSLSILNGANK
jgi:acylphosphatase